MRSQTVSITYFHYTITAYGKDIEPGVPGIEESMEPLIKLSEQDMDTLAQGLGAIAERNGIFIQACGTNGDFSRYHIHWTIRLYMCLSYRQACCEAGKISM